MQLFSVEVVEEQYKNNIKSFQSIETDLQKHKAWISHLVTLRQWIPLRDVQYQMSPAQKHNWFGKMLLMEQELNI